MILAITLCAAEGLLRLKNLNQANYTIEMWRYAKELKVASPDPLLGHLHVPGRSARLENVMIRLNSYGLRGPELEPQGPHHHLRILFLGSSNTLGWGVEEDGTLPAVLQRELGKNVEVLNGGIGNYNAVRYVRLFETKLRALKPDVVIVHYFIRDAEVLDDGRGNFLLRHSELAVEIDQVIQLLKMGQAENGGLINYYKNFYKDDSEGFQDMAAALRKLDKMSKEDGFKVVLAITPESHFLKDFPYTAEHAKVMAIGRQLGWPSIDFTPVLQKVPQEQLWVMPSDPHYNSQGFEIMGRALLPVVQKVLAESERK